MDFKKFFYSVFNEVSEDELEKIDRLSKFDKKDLKEEPFNDIFKDKFRIVIPILEKNQKDFYDFLIKNNLSDIDFAKGTGKLNVKTDRGYKLREIRIGKFLEELKDKHWLDFWQKNKIPLSRKNQEGVSVVISRHPIDIVRMSDHSEWSSCHSFGDSFWKCALQEAKTGGAIAYVVRNKDLSNVSDIQAKDIFEDKNRKIQGIEPLERIRLRRFQDDNHDYLVPELRTYGIKHVGFADTLKQWALNVQEDKLKDVDYSKLKLRGGSQQDNNANDLWSSFLDKKFTGYKNSIDRDESGMTNERAQEMIDAHNYKHFSASFDITHTLDDMHHIDCYAYVSFSFAKEEFINEFPEKSRNDMQEFRRRNDLEREIKQILDINIDIREIELEEDEITISFSDGPFDAEDENEFERFLDNLDKLDTYYNNLYMRLYHLLWEEGYIENKLENVPLKNLKFVFDVNQRQKRLDSYGYESFPKKIGSLEGVPEEVFSIQNRNIMKPEVDLENHPKNLLKKAILANLNFHALGIGIADVFVKLFVSNKHKKPISTDSSRYADEPMKSYGDVPVYFSFSFDIAKIDEDTIKEVKKIDEHFPKLLSNVTRRWEQLTKTHKERTEKIEDNPSVKRTIYNISAWFRNHRQQGQISIKNNQYWYTDKEAGFDAPVKDVMLAMEQFEAVSDQYRRKISIELLRSGHIVIKYKNQQPQYFWFDNNDQLLLPVDKAIEKYHKEYQDKINPYKNK